MLDEMLTGLGKEQPVILGNNWRLLADPLGRVQFI